jgi:hypothetical protein
LNLIKGVMQVSLCKMFLELKKPRLLSAVVRLLERLLERSECEIKCYQGAQGQVSYVCLEMVHLPVPQFLGGGG